ncbi:MAG: serine/threonine protein phosphatase [Proteobacteria bacterium]|nr:serine/threonine protein phosphatase [Pseudomonadota bacterium]
MAVPFKEFTELPPRIFAVGDIHGCRDEAAAMVDFLITNRSLTQNDQLIFIGDYIDRGPDSKGVIDLMLRVKREYPRTIFLKGNHEDMLLSFLGLEGTAGMGFLLNGGDATLRSYGIDPTLSPDDVYRKIPPVHIEFFRTLDSYAIIAGYVFVHAGLNPLRDLRDQSYDDLYWIRNEFIYNVHRFEKTVVFGHTPFLDVLFHLPFKIGVDTGLVYDNKLSCIELSAGEVLQVARGGNSVTVRSFQDVIKEQEGN